MVLEKLEKINGVNENVEQRKFWCLKVVVKRELRCWVTIASDTSHVSWRSDGRVYAKHHDVNVNKVCAYWKMNRTSTLGNNLFREPSIKMNKAHTRSTKMNKT